MNIKSKKSFIFTVIVAIILGLAFTLSINAYYVNNRGLRSVPADVYIASHTTTNERNRTTDAMSTWNNNALGYTGLSYAGVTLMQNYNVYDGMNCVTKITYAGYIGYCFYVKTSYLGGGTYIDEFDITISNDSNITWYTSTGTCPSSDVDWQSNILHEFGHALGLGHTNPTKYFDFNGIQQRIVMYQGLSYGEMVRNLSYDDMSGIFYLY